MFSYADIKDSDLSVTLLSHSTNGPDEECYLPDLLFRVAREDKISFLILAIEKETFILYTVQIRETSACSIEDAVYTFDKFVRSARGSHISTLYKIETDSSQHGQKAETTSCLATLSRTRGTFFNSLSLPVADSELLKTRLKFEERQSTIKRIRAILTSRASWKDHLWVRISFWSTLIFLFILLVAIFRDSTFHQHFENGIWVRYNLKGSQGPKYQLEFRHQNVSKWAAKTPHENGEWALRIDDQAMIPAHLMDEEEIRYQRWFQERYPEKNQIRLNRDYLNETFLADPNRMHVPTDMAFHMAHCVRALRRYWQAKETGHHVCPRDIDFRHMKHCLDALDEWAFIDGERGSVKVPVDSGTWRLIWKTKVCF